MNELIGNPYVGFSIIIFSMIGILIVIWALNDRKIRHDKRDTHNRTLWQVRMLNERKHTSNLL